MDDDRFLTMPTLLLRERMRSHPEEFFTPPRVNVAHQLRQEIAGLQSKNAELESRIAELVHVRTARPRQWFPSLEVKSLDADRREIEGVCSSYETDLIGDRLDPSGATWGKDTPFCWQHSTSDPVGWVMDIHATKMQVKFKAKIARLSDTDTTNPLAQVVEKCWAALKNRLVRHVSIGFLPRQFEQLPGGGYLFRSYFITEISAATTPCNPNARIEVVRAYTEAREQ